jgi:Protein of unknown function (DUF2975)
MTGTPLDQTAAPRRDWLLTSARWLVTFIVALVCLVGLALLGAAVSLPLFHDRIAAAVLTETGKPFGYEVTTAIEALLALILVMGFLAFRWLMRLRRIIDSVEQGNAFAQVNAERLSAMGWLTVGIELLSIPAGAAAHYVTNHFDKSRVEIGLSLGGILMALVLFILARVFREGAAMREELEGTV